MGVIENTEAILNWCRRVRYRAWYLKEHAVLESTDQVKHRGRNHVLLQPQEWPFPDWLLGIPQSARLEDALKHARGMDAQPR
jgi:hypothetical protein